MNKAIAEAGLQPGMHEFKSGARMDSGETQRVLRDKLKQGLQETRLGAVVVPVSARFAAVNAVRGGGNGAYGGQMTQCQAGG